MVVGEFDGCKVVLVGESVGGEVGFFVVGDLVGLLVVFVGDDDGANELPSTVGARLGAWVGDVGRGVILCVGFVVGERVGLRD